MSRYIIIVVILLGVVGSVYSQSTYSESAFQNGWLAQQISPNKYYFEIVPIDKAYHAGANMVFAATSYHITMGITGDRSKSFWVSLAFASAISFGKEFYDEVKYGGFSWGDIAADYVGWAIVIAPILIWNKDSRGKRRELKKLKEMKAL